jgi:hypothetical protein
VPLSRSIGQEIPCWMRTYLVGHDEEYLDSA